KNGYDDEYKIEDVFKMWLKEIFVDTYSEEFYSNCVNELVKLELSFEEENCYLDNEILMRIDSIRAKNKVFLSDFYMSNEQVKYLLEKKGFPKHLLQGFTSADLGYNKRSGNIFNRIEELFNITKPKHIHLGDNVFSDYFIPMHLGISSILYFNQHEENKRNKHNRFKLRRSDRTSYFVELQQSYRELIRNNSSKSDELFNIGLDTSLLLFNFILFIIEEVVSEGFNKLYFFTREGEFFIKIYNEIKKSNLFDFELPEAYILEVSRLSTFAPSIREITTQEFMRIWNLYSKQTVSALFKSLNVVTDNFLPILSKYNLKPETEIIYPWTDERIKNLFSDIDFKQKLLNEISKQKELFIEYFKAKGIENNGSKIAIVDIGWRGTIQDNLAYIFDKNIFYGYYFGLFKYLNTQPVNSLKKAFIANQNIENSKNDILLNFVSPIEMLFNSDGGSVKKYYKNESEICAKREIEPSEEEVFIKYTKYFQNGVLSAIPYLSNYVRRYSLTSVELKRKSIDILKNLINNPPQIISEAYYSLNHNESFGLGKYENKSKFLQEMNFIKEEYLRGNFSSFEENLHRTTWPQGFLRLCNMRYNFFNLEQPIIYRLTIDERNNLKNLCDKALVFYMNGEYKESLKYALEALSIDPNRISTLYLLYKITQHISMKEAMGYLKKILNLYNREPKANNELARLSFSIGDIDKAIKILQKIKDDNYTIAQLNLSKLYLNKFYMKSKKIPPFLQNSIIKEYSKELFEDFNSLESNKNIQKSVNVFNEEFTKTSINQKKMNYEVSILVATFNGLEYTQKFIESLISSTDINYELIIVDNNSHTELLRYLKRLENKINNIKIIYNKENYGFPKAINQAILLANSNYLLIVNNDIIFTEKSIDRLIDFAKTDPNIGIVAPISNEVSGLQRDLDAKYTSIEEMHKYSNFIRENNKGQLLFFPRVAFLCTLIKKELIEKIGGLDERFSPGNYEDDDFCLRAQLAGFKTVIAKDVFIHHFGSKSFKANGTEAYRKRLETNKQIFIDKWGATPDEIWLQNKTIKQRQIYYPIDNDLFKQYFERTKIHIA
ncbi:MAG: glycosyltransferase, partial [Melioribacter sp.]|nr:glycosyltransferase [Melioribacter sp.]